MAGAFFNILIPTEQHEIHFFQHIKCDCTTKTNISNNTQVSDNNYNEKKPNFNLPNVSMKKVSRHYIYNMSV